MSARLPTSWYHRQTIRKVRSRRYENLIHLLQLLTRRLTVICNGWFQFVWSDQMNEWSFCVVLSDLIGFWDGWLVLVIPIVQTSELSAVRQFLIVYILFFIRTSKFWPSLIVLNFLGNFSFNCSFSETHATVATAENFEVFRNTFLTLFWHFYKGAWWFTPVFIGLW